MTIQLVNKIPPKTNLVFVLTGKKRPADHPFFRFLDRSDQFQLNLFDAKALIENFGRVVWLRSGLKVLIINLTIPYTHRRAILVMRQIIDLARKEKIKKIAVHFDDFITDSEISHELLAEIIASQMTMANFEFVKYKTLSAAEWSFVENVFIFTPTKQLSWQKAFNQGRIIGEEINQARILANTPGGEMTPAMLAQAAIKTGRRVGFKTKVLSEKEIKKLKMGGIIGVCAGSSERPRFIIMEYRHGPANLKPTVLVGKGVTFDTGGLNLKPSESIYEMHMDMSGGAAVIHILAALARLKVKKNIIGLVPAVENMPSGSSYRPGDLLKTLSGKTIEVLNTDAEGRIILADALTYAQRYKPRLIIDVATLTGAAMVALGQRAIALFGTDSEIIEKIRFWGEKTGDFVWPLPLWEEFEDDIKGTFGDVANTGKTKFGGAITAAVFLWQFIKNQTWLHLDIAPRMTAIEGEFLAKGATGASINLLTRFLREF